MLMITRSQTSGQNLSLNLDGKLLTPWIGELQSAINTLGVPADRVCLDLSGLTFVDTHGARFLQGLIKDGATVVACSAFVAEMLQLEATE